MNILQLVPKLNIGGVEKSTVEVARYLTLNGHKAVVVSGGGNLEKNLAAIGARYYTIPVGRKNIFVMVYCYFKLKSVIRKESIDIVHARSRIPALIGYFAAKATHRTFITTAHGQYKKHIISKVMGWGKVVITANETMARFMKENFGVPFQKIIVIPRGVDLEKFSFIEPVKRKGKTFRIGMICRFTQLKGHLDFLKAAAYVLRKVHNIEIILMGDASAAKEEYIKKIKLAIRRHMLEGIVRFEDSGKDVSEVMKELDVLVSANHEQEAFGRSIIEAQARGVPVVATKVGGVVENITDGVTGLLCEPKNPPDMASKILRYIQDPKLMQEIAASARKHVAEKYSLSKTMQMTLDAYSRVLGMKNILILKISSLGDVILSTPSVRAIRERFSGAKIKALVDMHFREVFENCPYIDEVITCDFKSRDRRLGFLKLARKLRSEDFDISVDLQNNHRSHLIAFLSAISERYGYDNGKLSFLLNRRINLPLKTIGPVKHQSYVLGLIGITHVENRLELWPGEKSISWAKRFIESSWLKKDQKVVAISLSASKRWTTKSWILSGMIELTETLARQKSIRVVILGTDDEKPLAAEFIKRTNAKPIDAVGKTNISQLTGLIKSCDCLVTGDSAPMHIASAVGTPFVAIFGPTDPAKHLSPAEKHKVLYKRLKCVPCYSPSCSKNMKCMTSVSSREVFDAVMEVMK